MRVGSECVRGAWLRCAVGCWVVSDTAGCDGWVLIWLWVVLKRDENKDTIKETDSTFELKAWVITGKDPVPSGLDNSAQQLHKFFSREERMHTFIQQVKNKPVGDSGRNENSTLAVFHSSAGDFSCYGSSKD